MRDEITFPFPQLNKAVLELMCNSIQRPHVISYCGIGFAVIIYDM